MHLEGEVVRFPGASAESLAAVERALRLTLPADYAAFLRETDGLEVGRSEAVCPVAGVLELNEAWQVPTREIGRFVIATDGGGRAVLLDAATGVVSILDTGSVWAEEAGDRLAGSFSEWAAGGFRTEPPNWSEPVSVACDVVLVRPPDGGLASLAKIKAVLALPQSAPELLKLSRATPAVLLADVPRPRYERRFGELGGLAACLELRPHGVSGAG